MQVVESKYLRTPLDKPQTTAEREPEARSKLDKCKRGTDWHKERKFHLLGLNWLRRRLGYLVNEVGNAMQVMACGGGQGAV